MNQEATTHNDYSLELAVRTESALEDLIRLLGAKIIEADADETFRLKIEREELIGRRALVRAKKLAILAGKTILNPPTATHVNEVRALAKKIDGMVMSAVTADALLASGTELLGLWVAMQGSALA